MKNLALGLVRALFALVGAGGYMALAAWGWGGFDALFAIPALAALAVVFALIAIAGALAGGNLSRGRREDKGNRWIIAVYSALGLAAGYLPAYTDRMDILTVGGDAVRWAGVALLAFGAVLRLWPVHVLGHRFSGLVAIQENHTLQTTGIYSVVRHPSYLGLLMISLGWVLAFRSLIGVALTALMIWPLIARIRAEEKLLADHFGAEYAAYRARTWRLIPGAF